MELFAVGATGSWIWWLTDDPVAAEAQLRTSRDMLSRAGLVGALTSIDLNLAEALYRQGRYDEAEEMADEAAEVAAEDDINPQAYVRAIRSKILARRGLTDEAEALARAGVALADETDWVDLRGDSLLALGEVLQLAGRDGEAVEPIRQALELWEAKGSVRFAARASRLLSAVTAPA
jgi:tetratricopeptide (TPR) repeat protein